MVDKNHPFSHFLHKNVSFRWDEKCEATFNQLKKYLMSPPILTLSTEGNPLLLYIAIIDRSLGALLAQEDSIGKERAIYYISRTLNGFEINYASTENSCLAIVLATQQLRHYMLTHTIKLIGKIDLLKYILSKGKFSGRLAKWVMMLSKFDIQYVDKKAIKGQVIIDQIVEAPLHGNHPLHIEFPDADVLNISVKQWALYFDGSYTQHGSRVGILFVTPQGHTIPRSYRLMFPCTNNTTSYEALIIGIKMAVELKITKLQVYGDTQIVINQVNDDYQIKDDKLMPYKRMIDDFKK